MAKNQVTFLTLTQISTNPFQPRERMLDDDDFKELVKSVAEHGVLEPLVVADTPAGYQLIAGERRWRAAKKVGLEEVPVHLLQTTPKGMLEMALVENIQRVNLNALERAQALKRLMTEFGYTTEQIADKLGKSKSYVANTIRLLDLPDPIKDGMNKGLITEAHARALSVIPNDRDMVTCYRQVVAIKASAAKTEQLARMYAFRTAKTDVKKKISQNEALIENWQSQLQSELKNKASFKLNRSNQQTKIVITLKGGIDKTQEDLKKLVDMMGLAWPEPVEEEVEEPVMATPAEL